MVESQMLSLVTKTRPFLNLIKRRGLKAMFLAIDDLWLYNYHSHRYDGTTLVVFETIQFIEQKQWEIVGLEQPKENLEGLIDQVELYNPESNIKYMEEERKNNLFATNTLDFFVFNVPLVLVTVALLNRLFHCLFRF